MKRHVDIQYLDRRDGGAPNRLGRAAHDRLARVLAIAIVACCLVLAPPSAWAVVVGAGPHTFDGNLPANGLVSFNGSTFTTPSPPTAIFGVAIDGGPLTQNYPLSSFNILGGFVLANIFVYDPTSNGITMGDPIFATIPLGGSFSFTDTFGTILTGSFASATFTSAHLATAASLSASDANTLVLTPGPAFTFDTSFVSTIDPTPTGFGISLSSITGGVVATAIGPAIPAPVGQFFPVTLTAGGSSTGSAVVSGVINVVPEPGTITLLSFGVLALATPAYRRLRRKTQR